MNKDQRDKIDALITEAKKLKEKLETTNKALDLYRDDVQGLVDQVDAIKDEEQEKIDALPENMANGDKAETMQNAVDTLETAKDALESMRDKLEMDLDDMDEAIGGLEELI